MKTQTQLNPQHLRAKQSARAALMCGGATIALFALWVFWPQLFTSAWLALADAVQLLNREAGATSVVTHLGAVALLLLIAAPVYDFATASHRVNGKSDGALRLLVVTGNLALTGTLLAKLSRDFAVLATPLEPLREATVKAIEAGILFFLITALAVFFIAFSRVMDNAFEWTAAYFEAFVFDCFIAAMICLTANLLITGVLHFSIDAKFSEELYIGHSLPALMVGWVLATIRTLVRHTFLAAGSTELEPAPAEEPAATETAVFGD